MTTTIVSTISFQPLADLIESVSPFDSIKRADSNGREFWSAREVMTLMGYAAWRNFETPLNRAMQAAKNQGMSVEVNFAGSRKITQTKPQEDFRLSRFACYLVAMNGDPNKPEVAAAQAYFAIQTRVAETAQPAVQEALFGMEHEGFMLGQPVHQLPALPTKNGRHWINPNQERNDRLAAVVKAANGAWVPVTIDGFTDKQHVQLGYGIRYGKRTSFPRGQYDTAIRDNTLYIRHNNKQVAA